MESIWHQTAASAPRPPLAEDLETEAAVIGGGLAGVLTAALLEEALGKPPVLWDERRTTIDAHRILFDAGKNGKKRKKTVDAVAASLILEGYLTFRRTQKDPIP